MLITNKKILSQVFLSVVLLLFLLAPSGLFAQKTVQQKQLLKVALFPYIPDSAKDSHKALLSKIETEFKGKNPRIDLELRPLSVNDDFYDIEQLKSWLSPTNQDGYDVVEVDMLLLDELVKNNLISNWSPATKTKDWHPAGYKASVINNQIYGIPHWLCGHFIFSHDQSISKSKSIEELLNALSKGDSAVPDLTGDMLGSWNIPAIYLDVWADTYGTSNLANGLSVNLDKNVISQMKSFSDACKTGGTNPCLEAVYNDSDAPALEFANSKSDAFFGYSERLNFILSQNAPKEIYLTSAPIGKGKNPILFVDSLVKRSDCAMQCADAAAKFAEYLNSPTTQEWILMSKDSSTAAVPRYLIPATRSAFKRKSVRSDKYFQKIKSEVENAYPYPNAGFPAIRSSMRDAIIAELKK